MNRKLILKELRIQLPNAVLAVILIAMELALLQIALVQPAHYSPGLPTLIQFIHYFMIVPCMIVIAPVIFGASTIAYERQAGVLDWSLGLPASRARQYFIKIIPAILLSAVLGIAFSFLDKWIAANLARLGAEWILVDWDKRLPEPLRFRGMDPGIVTLFFAGVGAYASSIASTSNRAVLLGIPVAILTGWWQRIIDPAWMIFPVGVDYPRYFLHAWVQYGHAAALGAGLFALAFLNFRYERTRVRRLAGQAILWVIIVNALGWWVLRAEFAESNFVRPAAEKTPGITRLLDMTDGYITEAFRLPPGDKVLVNASTRNQFWRSHVGEKHLVPEGSTIGAEYTGALCLEIDLESGGIYQHPNAYGWIEEIDPSGKYYYPGAYAVGGRAVQVFTGTPIVVNRRSWFVGSMMGLLGFPEGGDPFVSALRNAEFPEFKDYNFSKLWLNESKGILELGRQPEGKRGWRFDLVAVDPDGKRYKLIDRLQSDPAQPASFAASPDGEWYARNYVAINSPMEIYRTDHSTTCTIQNNGGMIITASYNLSVWSYGYPSTKYSLTPRPRVMGGSPDGRFIGFKRCVGNEIPTSGTATTAQYQADIEFSLLDLTNGQETLLERTKLIGANYRLGGYYGMYWSDEGRLAVICENHHITLFDPDPAGGAYRRTGSIDLKQLNISSTDALYLVSFWDKETLLVLGVRSLWRVDLKTALKRDAGGWPA